MRNSPKIFLAPVSSSDLYKNYQKTIMVGIDKTNATPHKAPATPSKNVFISFSI
jgi:hypothetical protein